jgi:hypothetical protein
MNTLQKETTKATFQDFKAAFLKYTDLLKQREKKPGDIHKAKAQFLSLGHKLSQAKS